MSVLQRLAICFALCTVAVLASPVKAGTWGDVREAECPNIFGDVLLSSDAFIALQCGDTDGKTLCFHYGYSSETVSRNEIIAEINRRTIEDVREEAREILIRAGLGMLVMRMNETSRHDMICMRVWLETDWETLKGNQ